MSPDGKLYASDWTNHIYQIDTLTGASTVIFTMPLQPRIIGLLTLGGGIFYSFLEISDNLGDTLISINTNTGVVTQLGVVPLKIHGDMTLFNGEIYYLHVFPNNWFTDYRGIVKLNVSDPANSELVAVYPITSACFGITATNQCQTVLGTDIVDPDRLVLMSLIDGSVTNICELPENTISITSMEEFSSPVGCNTLDLDCNDSSGAIDADFNAQEVNCLSNQCEIVDSDLIMVYDDSISMVTVQLTGPLPDAPDEFLKYNAMIPEISVTGSSTDMITMTNQGTATGSDFKNALHAIHYTNLATPVTPGQRTVEVQYTLQSGIISNLASTYIDVIELPVLQVDLGPDEVLCEGEMDTLDAGYSNAVYHWSNNLTTQTITTNQTGTYAVTVTTNGYCPGADTISVDVVPVINVSLDGPIGICTDDLATLVINTNSTFPLDIEISSSSGSTFMLNNVIGNFTFDDSPSVGTLYTILQVTPSLPACVEVQDSFQFVEVFPTYSMLTDTSMCEGDSLFIANQWVTEDGNYNYTYSTAAGCDSMVTTFVIVWSSIHHNTQFTTCDSSAAGVFVTFLNNPNGCDTVVTTTITLLPPDTTLINLLSCNISNVGSTTQTLTSQMGCDSLVITTTSWIPPADTILLNQTTCDSALLGVFPQFLIAMDGCDSLVIRTITMAPSDTTYLSGISCDSASIGVFQNLQSNQMGCDSLVITTIAAGKPDTTLIFNTSCDSSSLGITEIHYSTLQGCDSLVITTVSFSAQDSTFISSSSCNTADVGVFIQSFTNQFGCDSFVTEIVSLLPPDEVFFTWTSCDSNEIGTFIDTLANLNGCDSIVQTTITLLPHDESFLLGTTCHASEAGVFINTYSNQYGCDSVVTLTVSLLPLDTTQIVRMTCNPSEVGIIQSTYTSQDGCDSLVFEATNLFPLAQLDLEVTSIFNGYGISCYGESDGSLSANVSGVPPYVYSWSTGDSTQNIAGIPAGLYDVTITDSNGCTIMDEIELTEPEEFSITLSITQPDCFDQHEGSITVIQGGGVNPVTYSLDGIHYQSFPTFNTLPEGTYTITALDANNCEVQEILWINVPLPIDVDLGEDREIHLGDTSMIEAILDISFDSLVNITWMGLNNPNCPTCLVQPVAPIISSAYSISVTNTAGCSDSDSISISVISNTDIYVPNVFSPNGDGINDFLLINATEEVQEIESFTIFDRWGNVIFQVEHFLPDDRAYAWDGKMRGKEMNPAVYAYSMIAAFKDGRKEARYGDISLIR
jgi:gliding motility-associated-like protein